MATFILPPCLSMKPIHQAYPSNPFLTLPITLSKTTYIHHLSCLPCLGFITKPITPTFHLTTPLNPHFSLNYFPISIQTHFLNLMHVTSFNGPYTIIPLYPTHDPISLSYFLLPYLCDMDEIFQH